MHQNINIFANSKFSKTENNDILKIRFQNGQLLDGHHHLNIWGSKMIVFVISDSYTKDYYYWLSN